jgi:S1-C subfamily serine protease
VHKNGQHRLAWLVMMVLVAVFSISTVQAKIYKWTDEDGKVHYSQTPPPSKAKKKIQTMELSNRHQVSSSGSGRSGVDKGYCDNVRKFASDVAVAMRKGLSVTQANSLTQAANEKVKEALGTREPIVKQIIYYVYRYQNSHHSPAEISALVYKQCLNGGYGSRDTGSAVKGASAGTGWPVGAGYVVTNHHVIANGSNITLIRHDGTRLKGQVVAEDTKNDLALIRVDDVRDLPPALPVADRDGAIGEEVFTIGFPHPDVMGSKPKLTTGHISATTGIKDDPRTYQISVPLQAGNSGGPLVNMHGEVVGVVTAKLSAIKMFRATGDLPQNVNYAVKIDFLSDLLAQNQRLRGMRSLHSKTGSLAQLAPDIEQSIMMVIAE